MGKKKGKLLRPEVLQRGATLSDCGHYRYRLYRRIGDGDLLNFIMLNPSTADAIEDDPTIRKCLHYTAHWGYGGLAVTNLYAWRATHPTDLFKADDPEGPDNNTHLMETADSASMVVAAWGANAKPAHVCWVLEHLQGVELFCLGHNMLGSPKHPLYRPAIVHPRRWNQELWTRSAGRS